MKVTYKNEVKVAAIKALMRSLKGALKCAQGNLDAYPLDNTIVGLQKLCDNFTPTFKPQEHLVEVPMDFHRPREYGFDISFAKVQLAEYTWFSYPKRLKIAFPEIIDKVMLSLGGSYNKTYLQNPNTDVLGKNYVYYHMGLSTGWTVTLEEFDVKITRERDHYTFEDLLTGQRASTTQPNFDEFLSDVCKALNELEHMLRTPEELKAQTAFLEGLDKKILTVLGEDGVKANKFLSAEAKLNLFSEFVFQLDNGVEVIFEHTEDDSEQGRASITKHDEEIKTMDFVYGRDIPGLIEFLRSAAVASKEE